MPAACRHAKSVASDSASGISSARLIGTPVEVFTSLLDAIVVQLAPENVATLDVPSDELHQEILLPLLPAMLGDKAIRSHWREQKGNTFFARLQTHVAGEAARPSFSADDFEIHVTASYSAGADARALADTLLSEESLRDLAANLTNTLLESAWGQLPAEVPAAESDQPSLVDEKAAPAAKPQVPALVPELEAAPLARESDGALEVPAAAPPPRLVRPPRVGFVVRAHPFRPQPWRARHNPIAGNHATPGFPNPIARNPLEKHSEPRHDFRAIKLP